MAAAETFQRLSLPAFFGVRRLALLSFPANDGREKRLLSELIELALFG